MWSFNDIEEIIKFYLIFNFIILVCLLYIIISLIIKLLFKNKKLNNKKKDIIELFWCDNKKGIGNILLRRTFFIVFIIFTLYYIFNSYNFIMENIDVVKKVLKIG